VTKILDFAHMLIHLYRSIIISFDVGFEACAISAYSDMAGTVKGGEKAKQ